jgi:hypothetical protein
MELADRVVPEDQIRLRHHVKGVKWPAVLNLRARVRHMFPLHPFMASIFPDDPLRTQQGAMHDAFLHLRGHARGMFRTRRNGGHRIMLDQVR